MEKATATSDYLSTPASRDSEESLLGSILIDSAQLDNEVVSTVKPSDFQTIHFGWVWQAITALKIKGLNIDLITIQDELERHNHLEDLGGFAGLSKLSTNVPSAYHAPDYAATIREMSSRRRLKQISQRLSMAADDLKTDISKLLPKVVETLEHIHIPLSPLLLERFKVLSAADALAPRLPTSYVIEGLLSTGSVSLLVGDGGSGKTYALIDAAVCVALGKKWLEFDTTQTSVLFVDEENGPARLKDRTARTLRGHFGDKDAPIYFVSLAQTSLYEPEDINMLHAIIEKYKAGLVIIDALADIMPGGDENAVKDTQPIFLALRRIADATNSAIVGIHHSNKSGTYRGSTALKGAVDLMLMLQADGELLTFRSEKTRDIEPITFGATTHHIDGKFYLSPSDPKPKPIAVVKSEQHVLQHLNEHGESDTTTITSTSDTCTSNAIRQAVYRLKKEELVQRTNTGGQGTVAIFGLTDKGEEIIENRL